MAGASSGNSGAENALLRLFRCLTLSEQEDLFAHTLSLVGNRNSFDPHYRRLPKADLEAEDRESDLSDRLFAAWPGHWPGQNIVELDNVGDAGEWLREHLSCPVVECLFPPGYEETIAAELAADYLTDIRREGFPLPSDFGDAPNPNGWTDDDEQQVIADFLRFLNHWRERILATVESQNLPAK